MRNRASAASAATGSDAFRNSLNPVVTRARMASFNSERRGSGVEIRSACRVGASTLEDLQGIFRTTLINGVAEAVDGALLAEAVVLSQVARRSQRVSQPMSPHPP